MEVSWAATVTEPGVCLARATDGVDPAFQAALLFGFAARATVLLLDHEVFNVDATGLRATDAVITFLGGMLDHPDPLALLVPT